MLLHTQTLWFDSTGGLFKPAKEIVSDSSITLGGTNICEITIRKTLEVLWIAYLKIQMPHILCITLHQPPTVFATQGTGK